MPGRGEQETHGNWERRQQRKSSALLEKVLGTWHRKKCQRWGDFLSQQRQTFSDISVTLVDEQGSMKDTVGCHSFS